MNTRPLGGHARLLEFAGRPHRVLDVGCSSGYLARQLVDLGATVIGIEFDPEAAEEARSVCEQVLVGDVETMELPFERPSFDLVVCGDLIEHLRRPVTALERLRAFIEPRGALILTTPNIANWAMRVSLLMGRWRYTDRGLLDRSHVHLFTRATLVEALEAAGFVVENLDFTVPVPLIGTPAVERAAHAIARLRPSLFAYQFVVRATPR